MSALTVFVSFVINLLITNSPLKCRWEIAEFLLHPRPRCLVPKWLLFHSSGLDSAEERNRTDETEKQFHLTVFLVKWSNFVEALFDGWKHLVCLCETLTWKSYLSTAGESVVPAHEVFGRVHTSQVFARYSHAPVSLCTITLSHNLQSSTEIDDYFSHV